MPNKCVVKSQMMISSKMYWHLIHHEIMIQKNETTHIQKNNESMMKHYTAHIKN